jgi:hypothetical protein
VHRGGGAIWQLPRGPREPLEEAHLEIRGRLGGIPLPPLPLPLPAHCHCHCHCHCSLPMPLPLPLPAPLPAQARAMVVITNHEVAYTRALAYERCHSEFQRPEFSCVLQVDCKMRMPLPLPLPMPLPLPLRLVGSRRAYFIVAPNRRKQSDIKSWRPGRISSS